MTDMQDGEARRSRLESEVLEILERVDGNPPMTARLRWWKRRAISRVRGGSILPVWLESPWAWFGIAIAIFLIGGALAHGTGLANRAVEIAGLLAVGMGAIKLIRPSRARGGRKLWRGRVVDMNRPGIELEDRFDQWKRRR